tara:strand:- start:59050 stop:59445 length:396 start_codon:yes stop_codon:yes gene_type:complete
LLACTNISSTLPDRAAFLPRQRLAPTTLLRIEMLYAIIATDVQNSLDNRLNARPAHLARLEQLKTEGRLILAGPHPAVDSNDPGPAGFSGSLIVAEFDSLLAAQQWAEADPYRVAGVYASVLVKPFKLVLP